MFRNIVLVAVSTFLAYAALSAPRHAPPSNPKTIDVKIISVPPVQPTEVKIIEAPAPPLETASEKEARLSHEANEQDLTAYTRILAWATVDKLGDAAKSPASFQEVSGVTDSWQAIESLQEGTTRNSGS